MSTMPIHLVEPAPPIVQEALSPLSPTARRWLDGYLQGTELPARFEQLSPRKRAVAFDRKLLLDAMLEQEAGGVRRNRAIETVRLAVIEGTGPRPLIEAAHRLGRKGPPSRQRFYDWAAAYAEAGLVGLAPQHKGSRPVAYGWEELALQLWLRPTKYDAGSIAFMLRHHGHESATRERVTALLRALPETLGERCAARVGQHYYNQNIRPYTIRDYSKVPVGFVYEGDGHTCDVYVAHPLTGNPYRPELTIWIDWRSHRIAGWHLWDRESGLNTLFSLSHALVSQDHTPALLHVDPGSGFKNRMMTDETAGWCAKFSVGFMAALPGNARGKGLVEGWFHHFEDRLGKSFDTFCGHCRTDDALSRLRQRIRKGELTLPSFAEYLARVSWYIEAYNREAQAALDKRSPNAVWEAGLERVPVEMRKEAVLRPATTAKVRSQRVRVLKRVFQAPALAEFEGRELIVEFDIHQLAEVHVYTPEHRWICVAARVDATPALPDSLIAEKERDRTLGRIRRKQRDIEEIRAQELQAIGHDQQMKEILELTGENEPAALEDSAGPMMRVIDPVDWQPEPEEEIHLDLFD